MGNAAGIELKRSVQQELQQHIPDYRRHSRWASTNDFIVAQKCWDSILLLSAADVTPRTQKMKITETFDVKVIVGADFFWMTFRNILISMLPESRYPIIFLFEGSGPGLELVELMLNTRKDPYRFTSGISSLTRELCSYGATSTDYVTIGKALLLAMKNCVGEMEFTKEMHYSWAKLYQGVLNIVGYASRRAVRDGYYRSALPKSSGEVNTEMAGELAGSDAIDEAPEAAPASASIQDYVQMISSNIDWENAPAPIAREPRTDSIDGVNHPRGQGTKQQRHHAPSSEQRNHQQNHSVHHMSLHHHHNHNHHHHRGPHDEQRGISLRKPLSLNCAAIAESKQDTESKQQQQHQREEEKEALQIPIEREDSQDSEYLLDPYTQVHDDMSPHAAPFSL